MRIEFVGGGHSTDSDDMHRRFVELKFGKDGQTEEKIIWLDGKDWQQEQTTFGTRWRLTDFGHGLDPTHVVIKIDE